MGVTLALLTAPGTDLTNLQKRTAYLVSHPRVERAWAVDADEYMQVGTLYLLIHFVQARPELNVPFNNDAHAVHDHVA